MWPIDNPSFKNKINDFSVSPEKTAIMIFLDQFFMPPNIFCGHYFWNPISQTETKVMELGLWIINVWNTGKIESENTFHETLKQFTTARY